MKQITRSVFTSFRLPLLLALVAVGLGVQYVVAWTAPSAAPPAGNVLAPLTTGPYQIKEGGLFVNNGTDPVGLGVLNGRLIVNDLYDSAWASQKKELGVVVNGKVGAAQFCDQDGNNCIETATLGSGGFGGSGGAILDVSNDGILTSPASPPGWRVDFTKEDIDVLNAFNMASDSFSPPAGQYIFEISAYGCGFLSSNGTGADQFGVYLLKNGSAELVSPTQVSHPGYNCLYPTMTGVVEANAGDTFTMNVWHDEVATEVRSWMKVYRLTNGAPSMHYQTFTNPTMKDLSATDRFVSCTRTDAAAFCGIRGSVLADVSCQDVGANLIIGINYNSGTWTDDDHYVVGGPNKAVSEIVCANYYGDIFDGTL